MLCFAESNMDPSISRVEIWVEGLKMAGNVVLKHVPSPIGRLPLVSNAHQTRHRGLHVSYVLVGISSTINAQCRVSKRAIFFLPT